MARQTDAAHPGLVDAIDPPVGSGMGELESYFEGPVSKARAALRKAEGGE